VYFCKTFVTFYQITRRNILQATGHIRSGNLKSRTASRFARLSTLAVTNGITIYIHIYVYIYVCVYIYHSRPKLDLIKPAQRLRSCSCYRRTDEQTRGNANRRIVWNALFFWNVLQGTHQTMYQLIPVGTGVWHILRRFSIKIGSFRTNDRTTTATTPTKSAGPLLLFHCNSVWMSYVQSSPPYHAALWQYNASMLQICRISLQRHTAVCRHIILILTSHNGAVYLTRTIRAIDDERGYKIMRCWPRSMSPEIVSYPWAVSTIQCAHSGSG
jgi:hypothetical protein